MKMLEQHYKFITAKIHPNVMKDLLPMDCTPACKWFLAENDQEYWNYTEDFPCLVPPSPLTWMEYEAPDRIQSKERTIVNSQLKRAGMLALTFEIKEDARQSALEEDILLRYVQMLDGGARGHFEWHGDTSLRRRDINKFIASGGKARWITIWNIIIEPIGHREVVTLGLYGMYLDEQGRCVPGLNACISGLPHEVLAKLPENFDVFSDALPFMFSMSLTHCKNVKMNDLTVPLAVAKKRKEKGIPSFTFKVLDIKPMRNVSARSAAAPSTVKNAMHFVRGHMKSFSPDKPLFGKHTGTYWWSLQVRGDEAAGIAQKEYRVQPA